MLLRALELRTAIKGFQRRYQMPNNNCNSSTYSASLDRITHAKWKEIRRYLKLLRHFVKAIAHLRGNAEHDEQERSRGGIWGVFPWMPVMSDKINTALSKPDEPLPFKTAL